MKKVLLLALLAAGSLSFTACDSKKEDNMEAAGNDIKAEGEVKADAMEDKADAMRDSANTAGEAVGDKADAMDPNSTMAPAAGTTTTTTTKPQ